MDAGFTITLESGVDVVVPQTAAAQPKLLQRLPSWLLTEQVSRLRAASDTGHGYTGAAVAGGITITAAGAITVTDG